MYSEHIPHAQYMVNKVDMADMLDTGQVFLGGYDGFDGHVRPPHVL